VSMEEINADVKDVRAARRAAKSQDPNLAV
jgi:hypothetical protein